MTGKNRSMCGDYGQHTFGEPTTSNLKFSGAGLVDSAHRSRARPILKGIGHWRRPGPSRRRIECQMTGGCGVKTGQRQPRSLSVGGKAQREEFASKHLPQTVVHLAGGGKYFSVQRCLAGIVPWPLPQERNPILKNLRAERVLGG